MGGRLGIVQIDDGGPFDPLVSREPIPQPAVVRRTERGHESRIGAQGIGQEECGINHLRCDLLLVHDLEPCAEVSQLHAANTFRLAGAVNRRFTVVAGGRSQVITAAPYAAGKQLLIDLPIDQTIHTHDPRTLSAKSRIQIFVIEGCWTFLDVTIGIDIAHKSNLLLNSSNSLYKPRLGASIFPSFLIRKRISNALRSWKKENLT